MSQDLISAAQEGKVELIKKALDGGADIHEVSSSGFPPLHYAMIVMPHNKNKDVLGTVKLLLENGANDDIDKPFVAGETPFMTACVEGHLEVVKYLYEQGAPDINRKFENGNTVLDDIALKLKHRPRNLTVSKMINGKKVTISDKAKIREVLGGHPDDETDAYLGIVIFLLQEGIDFDAKNHNEQSALFTATGADVGEMVTLLLLKGADVKAKDKSGLTPLHYACRNGFMGIVIQLIESGADVNAQDDWGFTPAHEAVLSGKVDVVYALRDAGADFTIGLTKAFDKDYVKGTSAIGAAKIKNNVELVKIMEVPKTKKEKSKYEGKTFDVPYKGWTWNKTPQSYDGADIQVQDGNILWYTHTEHHQGGGASHQEFADFLENGSNSVEPPVDIAKEIREHIIKHMK